MTDRGMGLAQAQAYAVEVRIQRDALVTENAALKDALRDSLLLERTAERWRAQCTLVGIDPKTREFTDGTH